MTTLKEAFKLCCIKDNEIVWLYDDPEEPLFGRCPMTGKQIREKYDMQRTSVIKIAPHFIGGDYEGFEFAITTKKDER